MPRPAIITRWHGAALVLVSLPAGVLVPMAVGGDYTQGLSAIPRQHAARHAGRGAELAGRGAVHTAEAEFLEALKLTAYALDAESGAAGGQHTEALTAGLTALREAGDFVAPGVPADLEAALAHTIASHETPILKSADPRALAPLRAVQSYYAFAEEQLAYAAGRSATASEALYGLARIQPLLAPAGDDMLADAKSLALHRAALAADPTNYKAANEVGVLLARRGNLAEAEAALRHSLSVHPETATRHNLAVVVARAGRAAAPVAAVEQSEDLRRRQQFPAVRWVEPNEFTRQAEPNEWTGDVPQLGDLASRPAAATEPVAEPAPALLPSGLSRVTRLFDRK
jgi:tetratricopeptide (TPR) repeat protein